jgi:lysophospholipase L1-like esterase
LNVSNTFPEKLNNSASISIGDGSDLITYQVQSGESTIVHSMPVGKKRVTITSGGQIKFDNEIKGVFIDQITFDGPAVPVTQAGKRIVVYGDSLAVGGKVSHPSAEAWPVLLRKHYSVMVAAYGYRTLYDDAATAQARSELATNIASSTPDIIWLAIGTNDYAFDVWSEQDFGEAYAATLEAIHVSNPKAVLFAQSPILRIREEANSLGDSLENYRRQIADACLARPDWCVFVDGTDPAFPQPDELDKDGVHLTAESSAKYTEAVLSQIEK